MLSGLSLLGTGVRSNEGQALVHQTGGVDEQKSLRERLCQVVDQDGFGLGVGGVARPLAARSRLVVAAVVIEGVVVESVSQRIQDGMAMIVSLLSPRKTLSGRSEGVLYHKSSAAAYSGQLPVRTP